VLALADGEQRAQGVDVCVWEAIQWCVLSLSPLSSSKHGREYYADDAMG